MNMTNKQLFEAIEEDCLKRKCYDNYLVRVRYKYKCETKWIYSNEYLEFNNGDWLWYKPIHLFKRYPKNFGQGLGCFFFVYMVS